jgi:NAD(P)H-dependent flavin oxidoreductase YrpB (nitropropane dioxygenase family)
MTGQLFKTRLTEMLGIEHPILCGGMMWLSDARLVAGVVNAGAMGFITPRSYDTPGAFREALGLCRELTRGRPFGVNLTVSGRRQSNALLPEYLAIALAEGVRYFETAGASPDGLIDAIHAGGGLVIHKASQIRHAQAAERLGADALILVGMEAGGHPGMNELPASVMGAHALPRLSRPLALGGAIGTGRQLLSVLALGADAAVIGTRLLVAEEVWAHDSYKRRLIACDESCSTALLRSLKDTWRVMANATADDVRRREEGGARSYEEFGELIRGTYARDHCYRGGDWSKGMLSLSSAAGFADAIVPVAAIIQGIMAEAAACFDRLGALRAGHAASDRQDAAPALAAFSRAH